MKLKKLKKVITTADDTTVDDDKNETAFAELIKLIDDRSLALVMREAKDDVRKALGILRNHHTGKGKPRVIAFYRIYELRYVKTQTSLLPIIF